MLTLVDHFSRVSPAIQTDFSLTGQRVTVFLDRLVQAQQVPKEIFVDNGPEFVSRALDDWAHRHGVKLTFSRPGTPTDSAYIESFNARLQPECLNENWFLSLSAAQKKLECHRKEYNSFRPHSSLGDLTSGEFTIRWQARHKHESVPLYPGRPPSCTVPFRWKSNVYENLLVPARSVGVYLCLPGYV